jgi:hypothetical protein
MGGSGTGRETDGLVFLNQFSGVQANSALLGSSVLLAVLKQRIVAKGFVQQRLN